MSEDRTHFAKKLIKWYLQNKRELPWRNTSDPYRIWLSEIILQQTKVAQGLPYYERFVKEFPNVRVLAKAKESRVLKLWQGLGYYSRARNLHKTAKYIASEHDGVFPEDYKGLLKLKGVGEYTASAIASICYNAPRAVVDGNVFRVLSRLYGMDIPINTTLGVKSFKELAQYLLDESEPAIYNQAIMEFGARLCVPKNPNCNACIFNTNCKAFQARNVENFPIKIKKGKIKRRFFNYLVFLSEDLRTILKKRTGKDIWKNLFEFPLIESTSDLEHEELKEHPEFERLMAGIADFKVTLFNESPIIHKLSHQILRVRFWIVEVPEIKENGIPTTTVKDFPVPVLIENFISSFSEMNI